MDPAAAQAACGRLVAVDGPEECKAVVLACPGLVPFCWRARAWCPSSWLRWTSWASSVRACPACPASWELAGSEGFGVCLCSWILSLSWILLTLIAIHHVDSASCDICLHTYAQGTQVRPCSVRP